MVKKAYNLLHCPMGGGAVGEGEGRGVREHVHCFVIAGINCKSFRVTFSHDCFDLKTFIFYFAVVLYFSHLACGKHS